MEDRTREKTGYVGVFYVMAPRLGGSEGEMEKVFYVRFRQGRKVFEEKAGRQHSDRMTAAKAARFRAARIDGKVKSAKERRQEAKARDRRWTVDRLAQAYFESLESNPDKSRKGIAVDRNRYDNFIKPKLGGKEPKELQPLDLERLLRDLRKTECTLKGKDAPARTLSPATIRATLTVMGRIINYGAYNNLCSPLPFKIKKPKASGITIENLNDDELKRLLAAIENDTNIDARGILKIALFTGLRRGEIFGLRWQDMDFHNGVIHLPVTKSGDKKEIPLNTQARAVLEAHPRTSEYVFPGEDGKQRVTIQKALRRIRKAAGLPATFRPLHGLRHAYASRLVSAGVDLFTVSQLLTHGSTTVTKRYAHLAPGALRKASELAGSLVDEVVGKKTQSEDDTAAGSI
jgi:integrase